MTLRKIFRRGLIAALSVIFLLSAAIVDATVKLYTASGEGYCYESESQDIAKQRAVDKAIKKATKQAGVYLKTYSRSVNSELTDDEITAITSNSWQLVGEPKFTREIINHSGDTQIIVWKATVEVNVDDSEIQSWIKRDDKDKSTIISQTREAQKASEENDRQIEDLREKYNRSTSQAEKDKIRQQMNDADRDFLANQKLEEGLKLYYAGNYNSAIKLYTEAIELKPNFADAYYNRGWAYKNYAYKYNWDYNRKMALADFNKAIELNPNNFEYYYGHVEFLDDEDYDYESEEGKQLIEQIIYDYQMIIKLMHDSNIYENDRISIDMAYFNIGCRYFTDAEDYEQAIKNFSKCIELAPNDGTYYEWRGESYKELGSYARAIEDFTKAIELQQYNKNNMMNYQYRGECYRKLGDEAKAQADFAKAKELLNNR